jgi:hypothetical protein
MKSTDEAKRKKQYDEDEHYRKLVESTIQKDPNDSFLRYAAAFYRLGKGWPGVKDTMFFPVKLIKARKSFGRLQCLITPLLTGEAIFSNDTSLGHRWVDRKFLLLNHDHDFKLYKKYLPKDD